EAQRAGDGLSLRLRFLRLADGLEVLAMRVDRRVARRRRAGVRLVAVRGALVFQRRLKIIAVLENQVRELVIDVRSLRVLREGVEERPVPGERLGIVRGLLVLEGRLLIEGVI